MAANMSLYKNPMPIQEAKLRNSNFCEVTLGYTVEQAMGQLLRGREGVC